MKETYDVAVSGLDHERKIGGEGSLVSSSGSLVVRVGGRKVVGELSRSLEHLSVVVGSVGVLVLLSHGLWRGDVAQVSVPHRGEKDADGRGRTLTSSTECETPTRVRHATRLSEWQAEQTSR